MRIYENLYVSEVLEKKKDKIIKNIQNHKYPFNVYVLTLHLEEGQHLEFYPASLFYQSAVEDDKLLLIGIASDYEDALFLVEKIAEEAYDKNKDVDIRKYLMEDNCQQ